MATNPTVPADGTPSKVPSEILDAADAAFDAAALQPAESPSEPEKVAPETEKPQDAGSTPTAEAAPVAATSAEESPEWNNLLAKYGGDRNKAASAFWETNNRAAQLAKEKAELEERLKAYEAGSPPTVAPVAAPVQTQEVPAELQRFDDKIRKVQTAYATKKQEFEQYTQVRAQRRQEITQVRRQIASPNLNVDRDELANRLAALLEDEEAVANYLAVIDREMDGFNEQWEDLRFSREQTARSLELQNAWQAEREAKARSEEDSVVSSIRNDWNSAVTRLAKDPSVIHPTLAQRFEKYVRAMGLAQVTQGEPITDYEAFIRQHASEFLSGAKEFHQVQSSEYGRQKEKDAEVSAPTGKAAVATDERAPRANWTPQQWQAYEENIQL